MVLSIGAVHKRLWGGRCFFVVFLLRVFFRVFFYFGLLGVLFAPLVTWVFLSFQRMLLYPRRYT